MKDYTKYSIEDLNKLLKDFRKRVMITYSILKRQPQSRKQLRKEIAKILTEIRKRELENKNGI